MASRGDGSQVPRLLKQHWERSGKPKRVTGDSHCGSIDVLAYLQQQGIEPCITPCKVRNRAGLFALEDLQCDPEQDAYVRPGGARLQRSRLRAPN